MKELNLRLQDTTPEVRALLKARYLRLAPQERMRMCAEMFETARAIAEASLPAGLSERDRRRHVWERFYGREFADRVFSSEP